MGARTTFASGLFDPGALAFDSAGNLFVVDRGFDYDFVSYAAVYKFTPSGVRSTVVSENNQHHYPVPQALAIDGADNLFVGWANAGSSAVYKFTPAGVRTTFASGVSGPLAFGPPSSGVQRAAVADFNGDGKPDYVLYNAATRQTAIWYLNNNAFVSGSYRPNSSGRLGVKRCGGFQ